MERSVILSKRENCTVLEEWIDWSGVGDRCIGCICALELGYVGGTGDVVVTTAGGDTVTFVAVPAGLIIPVRAKRIWETSTATFMLGLY